MAIVFYCFFSNFPESARTKIGLSADFFQQWRQNCSQVLKTPFREFFFRDETSCEKFLFEIEGELFRLLVKSFQQGFKSYILAVQRKTVRVVSEKRRSSWNFRNVTKFFWKFRNFFPKFSLQFFCSLSELMISSCSDKNLVLKILVLEKTHIFLDHFPLLSKIFRTFDQLFSSGLSNVPFLCPDELSVGN